MRRRLPPFGKQFLPVPATGVRVAIGAGAWNRQKINHCPIMVLPADAGPSDFDWPSDGRPALIIKCGPTDQHQLHAIAKALLKAGAPSVIAINGAPQKQHDPAIYFYPEVQYVFD